jgi:hypothetical protein
MRSPIPSFRSELAAYHKRLSDKTQILPPHWKGDLANGIINRWLEHPEAESIWTTLRANVPPGFSLTPSDFAVQVIQHRFDAEELTRVIRGLPGVEQKARQRLKRHLAAADYASVSFESASLAGVKEQRDRLLGREDSAPRTRFMRTWTEHFRKSCGEPLHDVVRVITEIAFDTTITVDAVRGASRPSTRTGRQRHRGTRPLK